MSGAERAVHALGVLLVLVAVAVRFAPVWVPLLPVIGPVVVPLG